MTNILIASPSGPWRPPTLPRAVMLPGAEDRGGPVASSWGERRLESVDRRVAVSPVAQIANVPHYIEVRKSSSRHASLYAKDKMFSAINWKGKNKKLLAVLVVDGDWTGETLRVMANVFDYVVPIGRSVELAETVKSYLNGDESKLRWLIEFRIESA